MTAHSPINPASGLPMVGDSTAGVDIGGNPYGTVHDVSSSFDHHNSFENRGATEITPDWCGAFWNSGH